MADRPPLIPARENVAFMQLGSKIDSTGRRWLTHDEISDGAIAALEEGCSRVIGEVDAIG